MLLSNKNSALLSRSLGLVAWLGLCACPASVTEEVRPFRLEQMRPRPEARVGVFLNEDLVLHFSADVDPSSVTAESLRVQDTKTGVIAKGRFEIDGRRVRFLPELGLATDLSDSGLRPSSRYEVRVLGFPAPDCVKSIDGAPLNYSAHFFFETAALTTPRGQVFEDRSPAIGEPLQLAYRKYLGNESLRLTCPEPIDPSTLVGGEFLLRPLDQLEESIPLDPQLISNSQEKGAELELRPRRVLSPGTYWLRTLTGPLAPLSGTSVRDFGGNSVWFPLLRSRDFGSSIEVTESRTESPERVESFLRSSMPSRLVVEDADGAAHWSGDGVVTVRFPRAAGSGADGAQQLSGPESRRDVNATRLEVVPGAEVQLLSIPGLVVFRAQGKMTIAGTLLRRAGPSATPTEETFVPGQNLTSWLAEARAADRNLTVLIAGGDIVVDGEIEVDGPLLLAAGGRIRVRGRAHAQDAELWLVGDSRGGGLDPTASVANLLIDGPIGNPLVESLTYAVLSGYLPSEGGVARWLRADVYGEERDGEFQVTYLPADFPYDLPRAQWGAVATPGDLLDTDRLRLLIVLTAHPKGLETQPGQRRGAWDPPLVDEVHLVWEPDRR